MLFWGVFLLSACIVAGCVVELAIIRDRASLLRILGLSGIAFWALYRMGPHSPAIDGHDVYLLLSVVVALSGSIYRSVVERRDHERRLKKHMFIRRRM